MTTTAWDQAKNILCIRLDAIGDVLMTVPALRALKQSQPQRQITLLTSPAGQEVTSLVPEIDHTIVYSSPWMKATAPRLNSSPEVAMVESLRQRHFDAAVIFTIYSQNPLPAAFLCYLAEIPLRLAHCHENPYQLLTDWVLDPEPSQGIRHEVRRQLDLVDAIGARTENEQLSLEVREYDRRYVLERLTTLGLDLKRPWLVIHPGATALSRRYPPDYFAAVARQLIQTLGFQVLFTGMEAERSLVETIQASVGPGSDALIGCLNLAEFAALLAIAPLLISNNTGPVHLAAAVGTPVVDLYALTNPQHTPWGVPNRVLFHEVPCKFCYKSICPEGHYHCLRLVTPDEVVRAACELMAETSTRIKETVEDALPGMGSLPLPVTQYSRSSTTPAMEQSAQGIWR